MPLVTLKEVFDHANREKIGVGSFNFHNMETFEAIIEAAEVSRFPVICGVPARMFSFLDLELIANMAVDRLRRSSVLAVLHLDHGKEFSMIVSALKNGFTSVMYDGSHLPLSDNIRNTQDVVRVAQAVGASVEGELGYVGRGENSEQLDQGRFTKVEEASEFHQQTGVDALAVAYGSVHGVYVGTPHLDFERLRSIAQTVPVPLVLHGGSGLTDVDFQTSIEIGVRKINIFTDLSRAALRTMIEKAPDASDYASVNALIKESIGGEVARYMRVFGFSDRH